MANTTSEAAIRALVAQGKKFPEIARELDVNVNTLRTACCLLGIGSPRRIPAKANDFLQGVKAGMTLRQIGAAHGVSGAYVQAALKRANFPTSARAYLAQQHDAG